MSLLDLKPSTLDIVSVSGDDVRLVVEVNSQSDCESSNFSIANVTFVANMVANSSNYTANIVKDVANSVMTATWTGNVTAGVGVGSYKWYLLFTEGGLTRTKVAGNFTLVARS
jgi:hypothetical protein